MPPSADRPIRRADEDVLDRALFAQHLASQLVATAGAGSVTALVGPWGTGKTSLLHMVAEALDGEEVPVVQFNPWLFSGTDELIARFFEALLAALAPADCHGDQGQTPAWRVRERLRAYAEIVTPLGPLPVVGPWLQRAGLVGRAVSALAGAETAPSSNGSGEDDASRDVAARRRLLDEALRELDTPMVILIDDLDRLAADEVAAVLRLVRLVADFPNTSYLLAFDQDRVHRALQAHGETEPQRYLEKIVQVIHVLPPAREPDIARELAVALDGLLRDHPQPPDLPDAHRLDVHNQVIRPLMGSLRSVRRYLTGLPLTLSLVSNEVAGVDACALEAIRLFSPHLHEALSSNLEALTEPPVAEAARDEARAELKRIDQLAAGASIPATLGLLFPAGRALLDGAPDPDERRRASWRSQRRVADRIVLDTFFFKALPPGVIGTPHLDALAAAAGDPDRLREVFVALPADALPDALRRLPQRLRRLNRTELAGMLALLAGPVRQRWREERLFAPATDDVLERAVAAVIAATTNGADRELTAALEIAAGRIDSLDDWEWLLRLLGPDEVHGQHVLSLEDLERVRPARVQHGGASA